MGLLEDLAAAIDMAGTGWMENALCKETDPDAFYPDRGQQPGMALIICARCEVSAECLEYALDHMDYVRGYGLDGPGRHGVWGGTTPNQREALLAARREEAA